MSTQHSRIQVSYSARGIPTFAIELWHDELNKHRLIRGSDPDTVARKAELQASDWDTQWERKADKAARRYSQEASKEEATLRTQEAQRELRRLETLLQFTLDIDDRIDWDTLKNTSQFPVRKPAKPVEPLPPSPLAVPREPLPSDPEFSPKFGFLDKFSATRRKARMQEAEFKFRHARDAWEEKRKVVTKTNETASREYEEHLRALRGEYVESLAHWEKEQQAFLEEQVRGNQAIEQQRELYLSGDPAVVSDYCDMVLSRSEYPDSFPKEFDLQ